MEVTYVPGDGVLVGAGLRWLLVAGAELDDALLDRVWSLLAGPGALDAVAAAVDERCGPGASYVLVDVDPHRGTTLTRGAGRLTTSAGLHVLTTGPEDAGLTRPERPLLGGVVAAASARLRSPVPPAARTGLIDGIPAAVLASRSPGPVAPTERPGATVRRADTDHDGRTTHRPPGATQAAAPPSVQHLRQTTRETVLAVHCPSGHVTAAFSPFCRVCHVPVTDGEPQRVPRPTLGVLHLPDGDRVPLDRGVVLGRQPGAPPGEDWPHLVRVPADSSYVSRSHLLVQLDGWLVLATDLDSRGGTTLRVPGRPPERIRGREPLVWEPGQVLDLADCFEIVYEVTSG